MPLAHPSVTVTPLHRLAAVLRLLDALPTSTKWIEVADVRRLIVGDLDRPAYTVMSVSEAAWLRGVRLAAEVAAQSEDPTAARYALRNQLSAEPKAVA